MKKRLEKIIGILILILTLVACGKQGQNLYSVEDFILTLEEQDSSTALSYAELFEVQKFRDKSNNIFTLITINDEGKYFIVPEKCKIDLTGTKNITVLKQPLNKTYLVSSSVMDFILKLNVLENVKFSGVKQKDWVNSKAISAMENGNLIYAGKYSSPDYDLLINGDCNFAIENTMIYHKPEALEKLTSLGIPVFIERSNYEPHPLGRLEWIKLYGILFDKEKTACDFYENQLEQIDEILKQKNTGLGVLFFYVNTNGVVNVRRPGDYISKTIKLAGGNYILDSILTENDSSFSSMNMQFEDFYAAGHNADIIIYNGTIDTSVTKKSDLLEKNSLFGDFAAWKTGKVYCAKKSFFQETTGTSDFIQDMNKVFNGNDSNLVYLQKLE